MGAEGSGRREPIAITGMGAMTPAGTTLDGIWDTLIAGKSVADEISRVDVSDVAVRFGCEAKDFDPTSVLSAKEARRYDRCTHFVVGAVDAAWKAAGEPEVDGERVGTVLGTGFGGLETAENGAREYFGLKPGIDKGRTNPLFIPTVMPNAASAVVTLRYGFRGPCLTVTTACSAGANAIGEAARLLQYGAIDIAVTGGAEAACTGWALAGFGSAHALSERNDAPALASRPFDKERDGFVIGEGAAALVLERLSDAKARGANVLAILAGYGRNGDAHHLVAPSPDGSGASACMRLALEDADLTPADVAHVNAHGTSTPHNDLAEGKAIRTVFGDDTPPVTSIKGVIGHAIGAAGAIEAVASVCTLQHGTIPPTANYSTPDPEIAVDVVAEPRDLGPGVVVSNSFAFGGHNAVLVFAKP